MILVARMVGGVPPDSRNDGRSMATEPLRRTEIIAWTEVMLADGAAAAARGSS